MSRWNNYIAPNPGLLFYKQIYKEQEILKERDNQRNPNKSRIISESENGVIKELKISVDNNKTSPFDDFYKDLCDKRLNSFNNQSIIPCNKSFELKTTYPGLLIGSGYSHDTKAKGDFKIGYFFDHTTGLPVIPGSSVKGLCRSVFEMDKGKNTGKKSIGAVKFILNEILEKQENNIDPKLIESIEKIKDELEIDNLRNLVKEIFGKGKQKGKDIFFDSILITDENKPFLSNDFITPHKHKSKTELDPFTNPNPIQFLKVRSNVKFEFRFLLTDTNEWSKEIKRLFFKQTLLTLGIGAKTNVGYGQFVNV
jgi:CRISPR-associated protein Cmr6